MLVPFNTHIYAHAPTILLFCLAITYSCFKLKSTCTTFYQSGKVYKYVYFCKIVLTAQKKNHFYGFLEWLLIIITHCISFYPLSYKCWNLYFYLYSLSHILTKNSLVQTDRTIKANKLDILVKDLLKKKYLLIELTIAVDANILVKLFNKLNKYKNLESQIQKMWHLKTQTIRIVIGVLGTIPTFINLTDYEPVLLEFE